MDKSREQFEAYFIQYHLNDNPEMVELFLKRDGEGYKLPCPNDEWRIWQASRAAVEIKIPEGETVFSTATDSYGEDGCVMLPVETMEHVIRAAGLKVKGE
ncbi:hypothetical protein [Cronobacter malonaticus]|uniref:hypothetical protein n=1 Tax=Cronobacter malonaticus TaxID=413503 RepID=UPI0029C9F0D6|nr:hypothetical protein [Cronobacter malonaticus]